jgi:hypothetical protein
MKTLRFLVALCIITAFFTGNVNAQNPKQTGTYSYTMEMYFCGDELITFNVSCTWSSWANKYQLRFSGIGEGDTSDGIYRLNEVDNYKWKPWVEGGADNNTQVWTMTVSKDGKPVGVVHYTGHFTVNANGVQTATIYNYVYECFQ